MAGIIGWSIPSHVTAITDSKVYAEAIEKQTEDAALAAKEAAEEALSQDLTNRAEALIGKRGGQCVIFVRNFLGVGRDEIQGMAKNTKVNSQDPEVGSIIVIYASRYGHVGVVLFTTDDGYVVYADSNGSWTQRVAIRKIKINDPKIKGYHKIN